MHMLVMRSIQYLWRLLISLLQKKKVLPDSLSFLERGYGVAVDMPDKFGPKGCFGNLINSLLPMSSLARVSLLSWRLDILSGSCISQSGQTGASTNGSLSGSRTNRSPEFSACLRCRYVDSRGHVTDDCSTVLSVLIYSRFLCLCRNSHPSLLQIESSVPSFP